jgi:hypothetical protein
MGNCFRSVVSGYHHPKVVVAASRRLASIRSNQPVPGREFSVGTRQRRGIFAPARPTGEPLVQSWGAAVCINPPAARRRVYRRIVVSLAECCDASSAWPHYGMGLSVGHPADESGGGVAGQDPFLRGRRSGNCLCLPKSLAQDLLIQLVVRS